MAVGGTLSSVSVSRRTKLVNQPFLNTEKTFILAHSMPSF